jgi:hypothetical protein
MGYSQISPNWVISFWLHTLTNTHHTVSIIWNSMHASWMIDIISASNPDATLASCVERVSVFHFFLITTMFGANTRLWHSSTWCNYLNTSTAWILICDSLDLQILASRIFLGCGIIFFTNSLDRERVISNWKFAISMSNQRRGHHSILFIYQITKYL